jgi:hypothetical protein
MLVIDDAVSSVRSRFPTWHWTLWATMQLRLVVKLNVGVQPKHPLAGQRVCMSIAEGCKDGEHRRFVGVDF